MAADRRLYLFRVSEAAWDAVGVDVPTGALAGQKRSGLEVRRTLVDGNRVLGVVVALGKDADAFDTALPGSAEGYTFFHAAEIEAGTDSYASERTAADATKSALSAETPIPERS